MKPVIRCQHCGAKMVEYRHSINKAMVGCLVVMAEHGGEIPISQLNKIITYNQQCNFFKLHYWGLTENILYDMQGNKIPSLWRLTEKGFDFLKGLVEIPKSVWSYRGEFRRFDGHLVSINDLGYEPYRKRPDYVYDQIPMNLDT